MYKLTLTTEDSEVLETWNIDEKDPKPTRMYLYSVIGQDIEIEIKKHTERSDG